MSCPSRRRRQRSSISKLNAVVYSLAVLSASTGVRAGLCSTADQNVRNQIIDTNKQLFQSCLSTLGLPTKAPEGSSVSAVDILTAFISEEYLQPANTGKICVDSCINALIPSMHDFPDCCTQSSGKSQVVRNLPRLSDDILHQCDILDARKLAAELEAEIAKLPDLKVQIKSVATTAGSTSGSSAANVGDDGVDVIIDVKKREMVKSGTLKSEDEGASNGGESSDAIALVTRHSMLMVAALTVLHWMV